MANIFALAKHWHRIVLSSFVSCRSSEIIQPVISIHSLQRTLRTRSLIFLHFLTHRYCYFVFPSHLSLATAVVTLTLTKVTSSIAHRERTATSYSRGEVLYLTYSGSFTIRKNIPVLNTGAPKWQAVNYLGSEPCSVHGSCKFVLGSGRQVKKSFLLTKSLKP